MTASVQGHEPLPQKSYREILSQEIQAGLAEIRRPARGLFLSSLSAGLDIGFSLLLMGTMLTLTSGELGEPVVHILVANMYSVGFVLVVLGRSELFTEHTALAVLPVLGRRAGIRDLARVWGVVYAGNLLGALTFASLVHVVGPRLGAVEPWALDAIARALVEQQWWVILASAVLAGWLMGELAWLLAAGRDTISQVIFVWLITTAIGLVGLHHSIAGTAEVFAGVLVGLGVDLADFFRFLALATLGNAVGGVVFVALVKYGHATQTSPEEERAT